MVSLELDTGTMEGRRYTGRLNLYLSIILAGAVRVHRKSGVCSEVKYKRGQDFLVSPGSDCASPTKGTGPIPGPGNSHLACCAVWPKKKKKKGCHKKFIILK